MFEAVANGDGPALGPRAGDRRAARGHQAAGASRNIVWLTADVHYTAAHHYDPERPRSATSRRSGSSSAARCMPAASAPTRRTIPSASQVVWQQAAGGRANLSPAEGGQYFGEAAIDGRSGVLTILLKDMEGTALWQRSFAPEAA